MFRPHRACRFPGLRTSCPIAVAAIAWVLTSSAVSAPITPERAARVARAWVARYEVRFGVVASENATPTDQNAVPLTSPDGVVAGYRFPLGALGSMVIAADDSAAPILFVSETNVFRPDGDPAVQAIWSAFCERLGQGGNPSPQVLESWASLEAPPGLRQPALANWSSSFPQRRGPLLRTHWNQNAPYWNECPIAPDGRRCFVGCVATAMAQVIRYWQTPIHGTSSHCYLWNNGVQLQELCADYGATQYEWRRMPENASSLDQGQVALLSSQCGVALEMSYSPDSSGSAPQAVGPSLQSYFGFAPGSTFFWRDTQTDEAWYTEARAQVAAGWPVVFSLGPHVVVLDGFDDAGQRVHLNMGWGGASDGWYQFPAVPYGWVQGTGMGVNIRPLGHRDGPRARTVAADGFSAEYATIQAAILASGDGDEIVLQPGTYSGWGNRDLDFWGKAIAVRSSDPGNPDIVRTTILHCQGSASEQHRAFLFHNGETSRSVVAGLTITGGFAGQGAYELELLPGVGSVGGAVLCHGASPTVTNCVFRGNRATTNGGAVAAMSGSHPTLTNCILTGNTATGNGGGVFAGTGGAFTLINCNLAGNSAATGGGIFATEGAGARVRSSILWRNVQNGPPGLTAQLSVGSGTPLVGYSLIEGWTGQWPAPGNVIETAAGPFLDGDGTDNVWGTPDDDLHLRPGSTAIDAGDGAALPGDLADLDRDANTAETTSLDLAGNPRIAGVGGLIDIGVYEYGSIHDCDHNGMPDGVQADSDADGTPDACDNCPPAANPGQTDTDGDGAGDACDDDDDADGRLDAADNCPLIANAAQQDGDNDGVGDACDNCPATANPDQADTDGNHVGNACESRILFVKAGASGANTGRSWADAYRSLDDALQSAAASGGTTSEIWVAQGTYKPSRQSMPGLPRSETFRLVDGVALYGGFTGHESNRQQRHASAMKNATVLNGDLAGDDFHDAGRWDSSKSDNAYHVVDGSDVGPASVLDGFTITGGWSINGGGGMAIRNGSPVVRNCRFFGNAAVNGGALENRDGSPLVSHCVFSGNTADDNGGGITSYGGQPVMSNCVVSANRAERTGGGISFTGDVTIVGCTFYGNIGVWDANAVAIFGGGKLIGSIFWGPGRTGEANQIRSSTYISPEVQNCCIQSWTGAMEGSILHEHPRFVNAVGVDGIVGTLDDQLRLSAHSPCIDVGNAGPDPAPDVDLDGQPRVRNCRIDMGAYEATFLRDCDGDGIADACRIGAGESVDCNENGIPDDCDLLSEPRLLVADTAGGRLLEFDGRTGVFTRVLVDGHPDIRNAAAMVPDARRDVCVASGASDRVLKFSRRSGQVIGQYSGGGLSRPTALLIVGQSLLVAGGATNSVIEYDIESADVLRTVVQPGAGGLDGPSSLLMWNGKLLVVSSNTNQVLEYEWLTGEFKRVVAVGGGLIAPSSLLLDYSGNLLVASTGNNAVLKYAEDGTFLGQFVASNTAGLSGPRGMVYDTSGNILICSTAPPSVLAFSAWDGSPADRDPTLAGIQPEAVTGIALGTPACLGVLSPMECNGNGVPDACELASGVTTDCNENKTIDSCEPDSDSDGTINACDNDDDNDGVREDGDNSGSAGDRLCKSGVTANCDDNCPFAPNPDQLDTDDDGRGDACDRPILVNFQAIGSNDGTSWANAFRDLQDAIAAAIARGGGSEIWVAGGTYRPDSGTGDRSAAFRLRSGIGIYGGFGGSEAQLMHRRTLVNETILSGDLSANDDAAPARRADNSYHVVIGSEAGPSAVLDGFTIVGGNADGEFPQNRGGGLYLQRGSPLVANCRFRDNSASGYGGAVYSTYYGHPTFVSCLFSQGRALRGAGIYAAVGSSASMTNCAFVGNRADEKGGALYTGEYCSPTLINCTMSGNTAGVGGGILDHTGTPTLINCILWGNQDASGSVPSAQLTSDGGVPLVYTSAMQDDQPADANVYPGPGNTDPDPRFLRPPSDGGDGWGVGGNDDIGDLRLGPESPCIDTGNVSALPRDVADLDGDGSRYEPTSLDVDRNWRQYSLGVATPVPVDMGAYEYQPDCNGNGIADTCDASCGLPGSPCDRPGCGQNPDCDRNGVPDTCQPDSDADGTTDACEAAYGDYDFDDDVDQTDFGHLQACMSGRNVAPELPCKNADLDFDGDVDGSDFDLLARCMKGADVPANPHCIQ